MYDFIEKLQVSDEDKEKLQSLGAATPPALLSLIEASDTAAKSFLGGETVRKVKEELSSRLNDADREILSVPVHNFYLGANISNGKPTLSAPSYDVGERDRVFAQIQKLRTQAQEENNINSIKLQSEIKELEDVINNMFQH